MHSVSQHSRWWPDLMHGKLRLEAAMAGDPQASAYPGRAKRGQALLRGCRLARGNLGTHRAMRQLE